MSINRGGRGRDEVAMVPSELLMDHVDSTLTQVLSHSQFLGCHL
jgi:hypothetical protein